MQFRAHRGHAACPENTMPAFERAVAEGFEQIETDPQLTADGEIVLMHDDSVNRTCRNGDGSPIGRQVPVRETAWEALLAYDAGIAFGEEFRGTRIPRLEELLKLLDGSEVLLSLDKKIPTHRLDPLLELVSGYRVSVEYSCGDPERIKKILSRCPDARINYDGQTTEACLEQICALVPREQLTVWMYYDNPHFAWLTDRYKTSPENCARVKKYARLGIANICNTYEMRDAIRWGADVIEPFDLQNH